ncbi:helix-turn-helix transcriptional regulator [Wenyingzhuangia sp. IMCC45467]
MNITILDSKHAYFNNVDSKINKDKCDVLETLTNFEEQDFYGSYKEICSEKFKVGYGELTIVNNCNIPIKFSGETIEMIFVLKGNYAVHINKKKEVYTYDSNDHNIIYYTDRDRCIELKKGTHQVVRINLTPSFFCEYFPENFKEFKTLMAQKKTGRLQTTNHKITSKMKEIVYQLITSDRKGYYRKIHVNASILELLLLQLNQFKNHEKKELNTEKINNTDDKIANIKTYIKEHYTEPLSLQLLAKKFGTNEFTLKKNFKDFYGTTVFGYINDLKMEKSKKLLIQNKLSIGEVSEKIGYKNPQHFSTAFKKKYGVSPSKIYTLY